MDGTKIVICRLCLCQVDDSNVALGEIKKEMLLVVIPNLHLDKTNDPRICQMCADTLQELYDFKVNVLEIGENLQNQLNKSSDSKVCLEDIFYDGKNGDRDAMYENKTCRACLRTLNGNFVTMIKLKENNEQVEQILNTFLPEMDLELTTDPVICPNCLETLKRFYRFFIKCMESDNKIVSYCELQNREQIGLGEIVHVLSIDDIKIEKNLDGYSTNPEYEEVVKVKIEQEEIHIKSEENIEIEESKGCSSNSDKNGERLFYCAHCPYKSRLKLSLRQHLQIHREWDMSQWFSCNHCPYKTLRNDHLKLHILRMHKKKENTVVHKCAICPYQTKVRMDLRKHLVSHESRETAKLYKCDFCPFATKYKTNLSHHLPRHDESQGSLFRCAECGFQTKIKKYLARHMLCHQKTFKMYKCKNCPYQTKRPNNLRSHELRHNGSKNTKSFKCDLCDFRSRSKYNLKKHKTIHNKLATSLNPC